MTELRTFIDMLRAEIDAVRDNAARTVTMSGRDAVGNWNQLEVLMTQWRQIQPFLDVDLT